MKRRAKGWLPVVVALALGAGAAGPGSGETGRPAWPTLIRPAAAQAPAAVRYTVVGEASEARYLVREQLAGLRFPNDAVGVTRAVAGQLAFDAEGRVLEAGSRVTVDAGALQSDEPRRDRYVRRNTLETERYPAVVFVPTGARGLPVPLPAAGTVTFQLLGRLTVREATRPTTWEATATLAGPRVTVRARTAFRFADFGLAIPRVASVLSVEDLIRLEVDLELRRAPA